MLTTQPLRLSAHCGVGGGVPPYRSHCNHLHGIFNGDSELRHWMMLITS